VRFDVTLDGYIMANFDVSIGMVEFEACGATWNVGTNSAFVLEPTKPRKTLIDLAGRRTISMQTDF
jgi:urease beta subunit